MESFTIRDPLDNISVIEKLRLDDDREKFLENYNKTILVIEKRIDYLSKALCDINERLKKLEKSND